MLILVCKKLGYFVHEALQIRKETCGGNLWSTALQPNDDDDDDDW